MATKGKPAKGLTPAVGEPNSRKSTAIHKTT